MNRRQLITSVAAAAVTPAVPVVNDLSEATLMRVICEIERIVRETGFRVMSYETPFSVPPEHWFIQPG